jgi:hypothetical protein
MEGKTSMQMYKENICDYTQGFEKIYMIIINYVYVWYTFQKKKNLIFKI